MFWERKLTRPIDDPFWNKHRPGNRWNCKCSLEATDEPITPLPTDEEIRDDQPQRGLENNPGKDGQLFSKKHPYFPKNCRECGFNKRKGKLSIKNLFGNEVKNCNSCIYADAILPPRPEREIFKKIEEYNPQVWNRTYISDKGGFVVTENKRIVEAERSSNERGKFNKELNMCKVIADNGHFVEYLREKNRTDGTYDIRIDGIPTDLKCITGGTGNMVKYAKKAMQEQGAKAVLFEIPSHEARYYEALAESRRKCSGRIFFYVRGKNIMKEVK